MTWAKSIDFLVLALVSYQGVLLLFAPEYRNRLYSTVSEGTLTLT